MSRVRLQELGVDVPVIPATVSGILPPPPALAAARAALARGEIKGPELDEQVRSATAYWIGKQEEAGLDIFSDGGLSAEAGLAAWFRAGLKGFVPGGLVRTWGDRFVDKPVLAHEAGWKGPVSVAGWAHAQSLTNKPVKALLPGPSLLLDGCFPVRYATPKAAAHALARELRREADALVKAGCRLIEFEEPLPGGDESGVAADAMRTVTNGLGAYAIVRIAGAAALRDGAGALPGLPVDNLVGAAGPGVPASMDITVAACGIHGGKADPPDAVLRRIRRVVGAAAPDRFWVAPEGGLETLTPEEAFAALAVVGAAAREARRSGG